MGFTQKDIEQYNQLIGNEIYVTRLKEKNVINTYYKTIMHMICVPFALPSVLPNMFMPNITKWVYYVSSFSTLIQCILRPSHSLTT